MNLDVRTARDEIQGAFKAAWDTGAAAVAGYVPAVFYDGVGKPEEPEANKHWAEVFVRHGTADQASLGPVGGLHRFEKRGVVTVAIFAALVVAGGLKQGLQLAQVALGAFQGVGMDSGLWFKGARIVEVGIDGAWYHLNVLAEFRFDEFA